MESQASAIPSPGDPPAAAIPVAARFGQARMRAMATTARDRLGLPFLLMLVWLFFEFVHPPKNPFKVPTLIGIASFLTWIGRRNKQWTPQVWSLIVLLFAMVVGIPTAESAGWAIHFTSDAAFLFITICIPLMSVLTSVRKIRIWSYTLVAGCVYVGIWSMLHDG